MFKNLFPFFFCLFLSPVLMAKNASVPLEYFNQMPMVEIPTISPDGKNIAVILNQGENTQVAIFPFDDKSKMKVVLQLGAKKYRLHQLNWANNERLLIEVSQPLYIDDWNVRVRTNHLYSANLDGSDVFELRKRSKSKKKQDFYRNSPDLLSLLHNDEKHILVTIRDPRDNNYSSIFKVNVTNGEFEKYIPNKNRIVSWGVTPSGEVLLGIGVDDNYKKKTRYIYVRKDVNSDWLMVKSYEAYKTETFEPILFEPEKDSIIVLSDYKFNKKALWRFNIKTSEYTLIAEAPENLDVSGPIIKRSGNIKKLIGFTYNNNFIKRVYFDENSNQLALQISQIFEKNNLKANLYDWSESKTRYLIYAVSDKSPGKFFTYDKVKKKLSVWYSQYPDLENAKLASVQPIDFVARDGLKLHGYLTLPDNVTNPPVVLFPHGGPFARDSQYFDPFVQMFASKGYAVLQVNYRGSTGYGNAYRTAGYHEWGGKMQTDLIDAFNWLKQSKRANTDKACIVGASYGGYAALTAGYQTPDLFKCIVSIAGTANMELTLADWKKWGNRNYIDNAVTEDEAAFERLSPVNHAKEFKTPVLLIHGKVDTVVSYYQSKDMYDALKHSKKDVEIQVYEYGTHNLDDAVNRQDAMKLISEFLDKYLG
ncbi:alpha/beta hydrolase family protein [Colwellia sp. RE-S-Sl-9]